MVELLLRLEYLTKNLVERLHEVTFDEMTEFIERRERLVLELQQFSDVGQSRNLEAQTIVERILSYDSVIAGRMETLKGEARNGMSRFSLGRMQRNAYDGGYTADRYYFDAKK